MKKMERFREMTDDELRAEETELRRALFNLRLKKAVGQLEKPHQLKETKRDLARVLGLLKERQRAAERRG
ncbi:MAG: 50S ribosomal protein L29 [Acidobacteria bacterium]|nr:MAG: 50S ribosomal protein L29 [Acidobacteriota bacterium]